MPKLQEANQQHHWTGTAIYMCAEQAEKHSEEVGTTM